jgi:protein-disulfide isomerase
MPNSRRILIVAPLMLLLLGCGRSSAQSRQDAASLAKEVEALKAQQAEMQKSLDEIREFLRVVTNGKFGAPSLVNSTFDITGAPINGQVKAPVTLIEISDYHCPFCRRHVMQTQPKLYSEYVETGKLRHVFIHYPVAQLHPDAYKSHEAAACANDQGKFWDLHAKLFEKPLKTPEELTALAQSAGLDQAAFQSCMPSGKHAKEVQDSVARIAKLNVSGTPTFLLARTTAGPNLTIAKVIEGAQPYETFKMAIDELAAKK